MCWFLIFRFLQWQEAGIFYSPASAPLFATNTFPEEGIPDNKIAKKRKYFSCQGISTCLPVSESPD